MYTPIYQLISRAAARIENRSRYFTNKPCKHGHLSERFVVNCVCVTCSADGYKSKSKQYQQAYYNKNKEKVLKSNATRRLDNPEYHKEHAKHWRDNNLERSNEKIREWQKNNLEQHQEYQKQYAKENANQINARSSTWRKKNPHRVAENTERRNKYIKSAKPVWANDEDIKAIYIERDRLIQETGIDYQVDHYYPILGKTVCGLHVAENLQIITKEENNDKSNKHPEDFY